MWDYTDKVQEHFLHPRNVGELPGANAIGEVGSLACGDEIHILREIRQETPAAEHVPVFGATGPCIRKVEQRTGIWDASASVFLAQVSGKLPLKRFWLGSDIPCIAEFELYPVHNQFVCGQRLAYAGMCHNAEVKITFMHDVIIQHAAHCFTGSTPVCGDQEVI